VNRRSRRDAWPVELKLLVSLALARATHVGLVVSCVRENVVDLPVLLNQANFTCRKCLELLLLGGSLWNDNFEARRN